MTDFFYGKKVLEAKTLASIEKKAFQENLDEESLLLKAKEKIVLAIKKILRKDRQRKILLLAGKGNNAADGFAAAIALYKEGFCIEVFSLFAKEQCSFLCQKYRKIFEKMGGKLFHIQTSDEMVIGKNDLIIDGLLGTGFQGKLNDLFSTVIKKVNSMKCFVLSIDIPSGVDGNTGEVRPIAIKANETITFTLPKMGFYIGEGPNYIGKVIIEDIGLDTKYTNEQEADFFLLDERKIRNFLPPIEKKRHKYQAGSVLAVAGSEGMTGAACLAALAALRAGAGIVWLFSNTKIEKAPYEIIVYPLQGNWEKLMQHLEKAKAVLMGPGLGRTKEIQKFLKRFFTKVLNPCVIDADALFFLAENKEIEVPAYSVLTPHKKEMMRLLGEENIKERDLLDKCQKYVDAKKVILVLKGAPTFIFYPEEKALIIDRGDPALATAGTGDVLTGIIAAFFAQKLPPYTAAVLGVYLHDIAGEIVAKEKTSYSVIASDIIDNLSQAFKKIKEKI